MKREYPKEEHSPSNSGRAYESSMVPDIQAIGNPRNFPQTNAYPTFGGGLDEHWAHFIDEIDTLQEVYTLPGAEIVSKFPSLFRNNARIWYKTIHRENRGRDWSHWKKLITKRFGGYDRRQRHVYLLEKMRFIFGNTDITEFLTSLYRKIESIYPDLCLEDKMGYVLVRLPDEVQEQITTATRGTDDMSKFLSTCQRIILKSAAQKDALKISRYSKQTWGQKDDTLKTDKKPFMSDKEKAVANFERSPV